MSDRRRFRLTDTIMTVGGVPPWEDGPAHRRGCPCHEETWVDDEECRCDQLARGGGDE